MANKNLVSSEIFKKAKNGDKKAKTIIYEKYYKILYHIIRKYTKSPKKIDFLLEPALVGMLKAINSYKPEKGIAFSTYLTTVVNNQILTALRLRKRQVPTVSFETPVPGTDGKLKLKDVLGYEEALSDDAEFLLKTIKRVLDAQFPKYREGLLDYVNGYKQISVVKKYGYSRSGFNAVCKRFRRVLAEELCQVGYTEYAP